MDTGDWQGSYVNSFALVSYLPGPLAAFLDEVRHDFAPESRAKAHVTVLPPRPLRPSATAADKEAAWQELRELLRGVQPFKVELGEIEVFPESQAIYVSIRSGQEELERLHDRLNVGRLAFQEPYRYHPHVTVAQDLPPEDVPAAAQFARWRWSECNHPRSFILERLTFVQNTPENCWIDLATLELTSRIIR